MGHPTELIQFKMLFKWDKLCTQWMISLPQATSSIQGSRETMEMPRDAHKCKGQGKCWYQLRGAPITAMARKATQEEILGGKEKKNPFYKEA